MNHKAVAQFRKKPIVIEAMQYSAESCRAICAWMGVPHDAPDADCGRDPFEIETLEGTMLAEPGDWIIKGIKGEFYPCKPDIFEATYEPL